MIGFRVALKAGFALECSHGPIGSVTNTAQEAQEQSRRHREQQTAVDKSRPEGETR